MSNLDYRMGARHARDTLLEVGSRAVAKDTIGLKETARNMAEAYRQRRAEGINTDYCDGVLDTVELLELL